MINDYPQVLTNWANNTVGKPFIWGKTDCCSLACDILDMLWGINPNIPKYTSKLEALEVAQKYRPSTVLMQLGAVVHPKSFAHTADFLIAPQQLGQISENLGIVIGNMVVTAIEHGNVSLIPLSKHSNETFVLRL